VVISNNPLSSEYNITVVNYLLSFAAKNSILSKVFFPLVKNQGSILPWENIIFQEKSICRKCHSQTVTLKEVVPRKKSSFKDFPRESYQQNIKYSTIILQIFLHI